MANGFQEIGEEWPFGMPRLVFCLCVIGGELGLGLGQQQTQVLDCTCLADAGRPVGQCTGDPVAQAPLNQV